MTVSQLHTYGATATPGPSIKINLSPSPQAGDLEVAVVYGYNTSNQCYPMTTPNGWSSVDSMCTGSRNRIWTFTHVAGSGDTSYTFSLQTGSDYFSAIVYDLSGVSTVNPIDGHASQAFVTGTAQSTASLTPTQTGDLAIASFADAYEKDPTLGSGWTADGNEDNGIYLTTAHLNNTTLNSMSESATYAAPGPSSGQSNLLLIAPAISTPVENQPLLRTVSEGTVPAGTGLLWYGQVASESSGCPGRSTGTSNCQSYPNYTVEQDYCDYDGSSNTLAVHANNTPVEADFFHIATPISSSNRDKASSSDGKCTFDEGVYFNMNLASSDSASWLSSNLLNSTSVPSGGIFFDGNGLWYNDADLSQIVEIGSSRSSCTPYKSCDHQYVSGGLDSTSYDAAIGNTINKAQSGFHILLNNLAPAQTTGACYQLTTDGHCEGGHYNYGTYDSRVELDEFCGAITSNNDLDMIRAENSQNAGPQNPPTVNPALGEEDAVILNTIYNLQYAQTSNGCKNTGILLEEDYPFLAHWEEDDITAMQWMAPSSDGTPDEIAQQPYTYCLYYSCSGKDYALYPDAMIVPSGPNFTTSTYNIGSYTSAHDATDCPSGAGNPQPVQGDSGGSAAMVVYCEAAASPVFAASYKHCYFVQYDLGACIALFNTGSGPVSLSSISKVSFSPYSYQLTFGGYEWGSKSVMGGGATTVAGQFPWLSTSSNLYTALNAQFNACTQTSPDYCNGTVSFSSFSQSGTSIPANSSVFLVAGKPSNY